MKAASFDYLRPRDLGEAAAALAGADGDAKLLAGGQSLGPMLNLRLARPSLVIDISRLDALRGIEETRNAWRIGAAVTHSALEDAAGRMPGGEMLCEVAAGIAYRSVRNRGTIGGSLAHADPAADWPLVMQQWNVYRSRWCGRYWQELGYQVIPTVSWSTPESFEFCFDGLPRNSVVAVSALGMKVGEPAQRDRFMVGFREMIARLVPSRVLAYGGLPDEAYALAHVVSYSTHWDRRVHAHRRII